MTIIKNIITYNHLKKQEKISAVLFWWCRDDCVL